MAHGRVVVEAAARVIVGLLNPACDWSTDGGGCMPPVPGQGRGPRTVMGRQDQNAAAAAGSDE